MWWCGVFLTDNNTTPTKVVLSCFVLLVGLWQVYWISKIKEQTFKEHKVKNIWISHSRSERNHPEELSVVTGHIQALQLFAGLADPNT